MEDQQVGLAARLIGKFLRKMQQALIDERKRNHYPTVILINQWRMKIGVMHGDPRTLPGGNALKYVHSVGVEITNKENVDGKDASGNNVVDFNEHMFRIKKNKVGNSIRSGEFKMIRNPSHPLGAGFIDDAATVVTFGRRMGFIEGDGSAPKRVQGVDQSFQRFQDIGDYFYENLDFYEHFKRRLITKQRADMGLIAGNWY
jgi:RecA/RadA recombinase